MRPQFSRYGTEPNFSVPYTRIKGKPYGLSVITNFCCIKCNFNQVGASAHHFHSVPKLRLYLWAAGNVGAVHLTDSFRYGSRPFHRGYYRLLPSSSKSDSYSHLFCLYFLLQCLLNISYISYIMLMMMILRNSRR